MSLVTSVLFFGPATATRYRTIVLMTGNFGSAGDIASVELEPKYKGEHVGRWVHLHEIPYVISEDRQARTGHSKYMF